MPPILNTPNDSGVREQLFREMRVYDTKRGIYAADMLETARLLLEQPKQHPRQAEAAAYCIRQAVKEIFGDTKDYTELLSDMVQRVAGAKDGIQTAGIVNEEGLQKLYKEIDDLKERVCSPKPEACLKKIFKDRSGIDPEAGRPSLVTEYRRILKDGNDLMHRVSETPTCADKVCNHYKDVVDVLSLIFLPIERLARIKRLAELPEPQKSDLDELRRIMNNAYDFAYFASRMRSPAWFDMMDLDMLKSPSGDPPWKLRSLVWDLKDEHVTAFIRMLEKNFDRWYSDHAGLGELGFVCWKLGYDGLPLLVKTLQASKKIREKRSDKKRVAASQPDNEPVKENGSMVDSILRLDEYALSVFLDIKPNSELVELAEHLLSSNCMIHPHYKTANIPVRLVECIDHTSVLQIVEILVRELRTNLVSKPFLEHLRLSNEQDQILFDEIRDLDKSLRSALINARDLGQPTLQLIRAVGNLPDITRAKFEAWLYSSADDVATSEIVRYVKNACGSRPSNDKDGLLFDRLKRDGHIQDISNHVTSLLGKPPDTKKMSGDPPRVISEEEKRHIHWARTMHPWVKLPDEWVHCLDIVEPHIKKHDADDGQEPEVFGGLIAPRIPDISTIDNPLDAADKISTVNPSIDRFRDSHGRRSPESELYNAVVNNTSKYATDPSAVIRKLRHPNYVAVYFRGLAGTNEDLTPYTDRIVSTIKSARTIQWDCGALSSTIFYHNGEPTSVNMAGMQLIKKMVTNNVGLGEDSLADVWSVVSEGVIIQDPKTNEPIYYSVIDPFTIDDKPHIQAVSTLVEMILYAKRNNMEVPDSSLEKLTKAIRLTGQHGVGYHACIGLNAGVLQSVMPDWFEQNEQYLFGSAASAELGRVAIDMYLVWCQPDAVIMEKHVDSVLDAVKRGEYMMALQHLLGCMLYGFRGYEPEYVAKKLMKIGSEYVSKTGWTMFDLLRGCNNTEYVRRAVDFWDSMLKQPPKPKVLTGFGWWANVSGIDQERWEELMLRTCEMVESLERSREAAKRISESQTITDNGWRILARLINIDLKYDKPYVEKRALDALRRTAGITKSEPREHLRLLLIEHGWHEAINF